jgi:hypothetical protein
MIAKKGSIIKFPFTLLRVVEADESDCLVEGVTRQSTCIASPRRVERVERIKYHLIAPRRTEPRIWPPEEANEGEASFLATNSFEEDGYTTGARPYTRRWMLNRADIAVFLAFAGNEEAIVKFLLSLAKGVGTYPIVSLGVRGGAKHQRFTKGPFVADPVQRWIEDVLPLLSKSAIEQLASHANLLALRTAAGATAERLAHCA